MPFTAYMTANVPVKFLFEVSNNMVSGDDSAKKGTQLSLTEERYINKESEKQLRSRYDQFISKFTLQNLPPEATLR